MVVSTATWGKKEIAYQNAYTLSNHLNQNY